MECNLPDFSTAWRMPASNVSTSELKARFYYEFSRESQTFLGLSEKLRHLSRGEISRATVTGSKYPGQGVVYLHPLCASIALLLAPELHFHDASFDELTTEQRGTLVSAFSEPPAFREMDEREFKRFRENRFASPARGGRSQFDVRGHEFVGITVDWSQGPSAVESAMKQWFKRHKQILSRLKRHNKIGEGFWFKPKDEMGAKHPRQKYFNALRGLSAMRLLSAYTLVEAIDLSKGCGRHGDSLLSGYIDPAIGAPTGRSAWLRAVSYAKGVFQELLYPSHEFALRLRALNGLPVTEEPISYQRYCSRTKK